MYLWPYLVSVVESPGHYVHRGDPAAVDWNRLAFTFDGAWHDLDCSAIVPVGAIAICFIMGLNTAVAGRMFSLRKNGNVNNINMMSAMTQVGGMAMNAIGIVACDVARKVEYNGSTATWASCNLIVTGWFA